MWDDAPDCFSEEEEEEESVKAGAGVAAPTKIAAPQIAATMPLRTIFVDMMISFAKLRDLIPTPCP